MATRALAAWFRAEVDPRTHGRLGVSRTPYRTQHRSVASRRRLARRRLRRDRDAWLATRDDHSGGVYVLPLSFYADTDGIWFATKHHRRIATNVTANPEVEIILGGYLDAIIVDGTSDRPTAEPPSDVVDAYGRKAGYVPAPDDGYVLIRIAPRRLRVSRSPAEFHDRDIWTIETEPWATFLSPPRDHTPHPMPPS